MIHSLLKSKKTLYVVLLAAMLFFSVKGYQRYLHIPDLTVVGFINMADSVGKQSAELIHALKEDFSIGFISTRANRLLDAPKSLRAIVRGTQRPLGRVIIFEDLLWWPGEEKYKKMNLLQAQNRIKIAYSMCESTAIPPEWIMILNKHFDAVAVPDHFLVDVYRTSGVTIPIFELPLGLDLNTMLDTPLKKEAHYPMVFANLGVCSDRKNQLLLIRAFAKAFGNSPDVLLKINCRYGEKEVSNAITKEITKLGLKNIQFTQICLEKTDYCRLFQEIDCYVSISKGEGFSIQPREAMALGIPVIASNNTGQITICDSKLVKIVSSNIKECALYPWGDAYGYSFNCEEEDVITALREVYDHYDKHLEQGSAARAWVSQYQYENLKPLYCSLIKPKKIVLGTEDKITAEYLMTRSPSLFNKYKQIGIPHEKTSSMHPDAADDSSADLSSRPHVGNI